MSDFPNNSYCYLITKLQTGVDKTGCFFCEIQGTYPLVNLPLFWDMEVSFCAIADDPMMDTSVPRLRKEFIII